MELGWERRGEGQNEREGREKDDKEGRDRDRRERGRDRERMNTGISQRTKEKLLAGFMSH